MKFVQFGAAVLATVAISVAAHADPQWTSVPGVTASHIGVSSSDQPYVVTPDGWVYQAKTSCDDVAGICVPQTTWTDTGGRNVTAISVNLDGQATVETTFNRLFIWGAFVGGDTQYWVEQPAMTAPDGSTPCVGSLASSYTYLSGFFIWNSWETARFWATDCASTSLWQMNANANAYVTDSDPHTVNYAYGSTQWNQLDTGGGDHNVAIFSASSGGAIDQVPWFLSRYSIAYAMDDGSVVQTARPLGVANIVSLTDHHALIAPVFGLTGVYRWTGDIRGHGTGTSQDWAFLASSPPGVTLKEIAFSPGYAAGDIPGGFPSSSGSRVWAVDSSGGVWVLDDADPLTPVK